MDGKTPKPQRLRTLGRIGVLADDLRAAARLVTDDMHATPGADAYEYRGSATAVEALIEKLNEIEHFAAGWIS